MVSNVSLEKFVKCKNVFHLFRFVVNYTFLYSIYCLPCYVNSSCMFADKYINIALCDFLQECWPVLMVT